MTTYLCAHHLCSIEQDEPRALQVWSQLMQRGVKAYIECRIEAAEIYFCAALDVVEVRAAQTGNAIFGEMQWRKPAEFLLNIWLGMGEQNKILLLNERIAKLPSLCGKESLIQFHSTVDELLAKDAAGPKLLERWQPESRVQAVH